jgi:predicted negative regulator of RcsB-dependent stress response
MKSKRRHELQTNELADRLGHFVERVRPYSTTILIAVLGVIGIIFAWQWLALNRERERGDAWRAYMTAGTNMQADITDELAAVADEFDDTTAGVWASQTMADIELSRGMRQLFEDRALAETSLNVAKDRYREVLENSLTAKSSLLLNRARLGLAQVHEALSELDDAKKLYKEVADSSAGAAEVRIAQERLAQLDRPEVERWYNWFSRQKPVQPEADAGTGTGLGGPGAGLGDLPDLGTLPDAPAEDFMKSPEEGAESTEPSQDQPDEETQPKADDDQPSVPLSAPQQSQPDSSPPSGDGTSTTEPAKDGAE